MGHEVAAYVRAFHDSWVTNIVLIYILYDKNCILYDSKFIIIMILNIMTSNQCQRTGNGHVV